MTLIEVIIAIAVFALAALGVLSTLGNSASLDAFAWETNKAVLAGRMKLEEITAAGYSTVPTYGVSPKNSFSVAGLNPQAAGQNQGTVEVTQITTTTSAIYDVTVRIRWTGVRGNREEVLKTMIAEKP